MLTGGRSVRMGRDKALVEVGGRALARIAADALRDAGAGDVVAVGGDQVALEALGLVVVADGWPGEGPLGGVLTALDVATREVVVILSCDLPHVTAEAVTAVVDALGAGADVAMPVVDGRAQPMLAAWRRATSLPRVQEVFDRGERAMWRACRVLDVAEVTLRVPESASDADIPDELFPGDAGG